MPCFHPLEAHRLLSGGIVFDPRRRHADDLGGPVSLPCGQCIGCRTDRARSWSLRIMHEASLYKTNCFVTLTYSDETLPPDGSLRYRDFQLFMKRLRFHVGRPIRFYMVGEYGELNLRPHFHACLFNVHFPDQQLLKSDNEDRYVYTSPTLGRLWPLGFTTVADLTLQSAGYCARYCISLVTGRAAEAHYGRRRPEFNRMSTRPGLGAQWFARYASTDVLPRDYLIDSKGRSNPVPPYYDKLLKRAGGDLDQVKATRELRSLRFRSDNSYARLSAKEAVKKASIRHLKREL